MLSVFIMSSLDLYCVDCLGIGEGPPYHSETHTFFFRMHRAKSTDKYYVDFTIAIKADFERVGFFLCYELDLN